MNSLSLWSYVFPPGKIYSNQTHRSWETYSQTWERWEGGMKENTAHVVMQRWFIMYEKHSTCILIREWELCIFHPNMSLATFLSSILLVLFLLYIVCKLCKIWFLTKWPLTLAKMCNIEPEHSESYNVILLTWPCISLLRNVIVK